MTAKGWLLVTGPTNWSPPTSSRSSGIAAMTGGRQTAQPLPKVERLIFLPANEITMAQKMIANEIDMASPSPRPTCAPSGQNKNIITHSDKSRPRLVADA
jgi:hypothetical protein